MLKNDPENFQIAMDMVTDSVRWQLDLICLSDIVLFSLSTADDIENDRCVIWLL